MPKKVLSSPGRKKKEKDERILRRAQHVWRLVYIEGYSYVAAWKKASPVSKSKKRNWGRLAKKDFMDNLIVVVSVSAGSATITAAPLMVTQLRAILGTIQVNFSS